MMRKITILILMFLVSATVFAQYSTPGNGLVYTLDDLVANSEGALTEDEGIYYLHEDLTIAVSDTLQVMDNGSLLIDPELRITVAGVFEVDAPDSFLMDCSVIDEKFEGVRRSEEHTSELQSRGHLVCRLLLEKKKLRRILK